jgi:hypothetical protein
MIEASYVGPDESKAFTVDPSKDSPKLDPNDRNAPEEPSSSSLGNLRREIITMQSAINEYLTDRMKQQQQNGQNAIEELLEKKILDGNDEEDE